MKQSEKQAIFTFFISRLVLFINTLPGYMARYDEFKRHPIVQDHYLKTGYSKTKRSLHLNRLAGDIIIDYKGKYLTGKTDREKELFRIIGEKWESWGGEWGGRFGVTKKDYDKKVGWDAGHFQWGKKMAAAYLQQSAYLL